MDEGLQIEISFFQTILYRLRGHIKWNRGLTLQHGDC